MITNLINFLTLLRIIFAVVISLSIISEKFYLFALLLFFFAGLSDYLDGFLARRYNAVSEIGEILDPIADKILIIFILISLCANLSSYLIAFMSSLIISREIWVSALRDFSSRKNILNATKVTNLAKIKTALQMGTIFIYLIALSTNLMLLIIFGDILLILATLVTIYTGYQYTLSVFKEDKVI